MPVQRATLLFAARVFFDAVQKSPRFCLNRGLFAESYDNPRLYAWAVL